MPAVFLNHRKDFSKPWWSLWDSEGPHPFRRPYGDLVLLVRGRVAGAVH